MKLKEIPVSLFHSLKLKSLSAEKLKSRDGLGLPVVVSLTSIPTRLDSLHITIRSVLNQKKKPEKVILWLNEELKGKIPESLNQFVGEIFEIRFTHLHCSHKKLIHTLKLYPEKPVVTCDDDVIYRDNWLETLYKTYLKFPEHIVAHRLRCIKTDRQGFARPYKSWILDDQCQKERFLPIGAEGVLYPPGVFSDMVFDEELFLELAPKADDLWFKAVALSEGKYAIKAENSPKIAIPIMGTQKVSLKSENVDEDRNRTQWDALAKHFNLQFKN